MKIEGRLKRPEYVYIVTSIYRRALDKIREGSFRPDDPEAMEELTQILYFNSRPPVVDDKFREEVEKERFLFN